MDDIRAKIAAAQAQVNKATVKIPKYELPKLDPIDTPVWKRIKDDILTGLFEGMVEAFTKAEPEAWEKFKAEVEKRRATEASV